MGYGLVAAGVRPLPPPPQGTKLEPLLFVIMINDLGIPGTYLLKYDDDKTVSETVSKGQKAQHSECFRHLVNASVDKFERMRAEMQRFALVSPNPPRSTLLLSTAKTLTLFPKEALDEAEHMNTF